MEAGMKLDSKNEIKVRLRDREREAQTKEVRV